MKYYLRGRKPKDRKELIYEIGVYSTKEIAEHEAEKVRKNGWLFVGVTTVPMEYRK